MSAIPYLVKKGDTLDSIASELGISDSYDLRNYHNANSDIDKGLRADVEAGNTLLTPPQDKIDALNAKHSDQDDSPASEEQAAQQEEDKKEEEQQEEEKKEEEKKEETKSEHDDQYFVVHKAECYCSKAELGDKTTAKLQVTSHQKVILNDEKDKYFATEIDKTFDPASSTFGNCKMQPSSSGYLPCTLTAGPKWEKPYEKTKVLGNKVLTMKSILKCIPFNGEIKLVKHGQTDAVMKEHAENTNAAAMAMVNPAVKLPEPEVRYPSVKNITLKSLKNNDAFKSVTSENPKNIKKVTIRPKQECTFEAKITEGNVNLTSWVIYDGFTGDKDKRLYAEEQIGTSFKYKFPTLGKYRVEGYGKPKTEEYKKGAHDKNYPDCSLDIEVVENKLVGNDLLPIDGENFFKVIGGKKRIRQNFPANFQANFLMIPTDEELKELKFYVTDGEGNGLKSTVVNNSVAFTPTNTNAPYHFKAEYKTVSGEVLKQSFSAQTVPNSVASINDNNPEVIRAGTPMTFSVKEGTFSYYIPNDEKAEMAINKEFNEVKWNLNGRLLGTGKSITIPGNQFLTKGKYVVEAFVIKANAYGTAEKTADEPDDWRFEVKDNDVLSFKCIEVPKVGKTTQLQADSFVFAKLTNVEQVVWKLAIPNKAVDKNTISITPVAAGKQNVKCSINNRAGKTLSIDVKQAKVVGMLFTDSNGIEIQKASWGQKVNLWIEQEHLIGEEIKVEVWDDDTASTDDRVATFDIKSYDGGLISFALTPKVKEETGTHGKLYVRVKAPKLKLGNADGVFESKNFLDVQDKRELYAAHIGSQDGTMRHYHVDYNKISYFYAKSRGIDPKEQLNLTIYQKDKSLLEAKNVHVDESGMIKIKLEWNKVNSDVSMRVVHAVLKGKDGNILYSGAQTGGAVALTKKSALQGLAEYKSAVLVGSGGASIGSKKENKNIACECEARVRAFLRMLRIGEGTGELVKSFDKKQNKIVYIPHDFQKGYITAFGGNIISDLSTHPMQNYGGSTAAGAYQIMRYTYAWLGGSKLRWTGEYYSILDIYEKDHDYRKMYNIKDYQPESQDKLCVIIMKHKQKGLLDLIVKGDIEKAIRNQGSGEWASLPHIGDNSRHDYKGKPQPATPFKVCMEHYNKLLKEELNEISNLHLKKGFLKDMFNYKCCDDKTNGITECKSCNKKHIDLRDKIEWQSQFDPKWGDYGKQSKACKKTCDDILIKNGLKATSLDRLFQTAIENANHTKLIIDSEVYKKGIAYMDSELEKGNPVQLGVDHDLNYKIDNNADQSTDHFIVVVGRGCEDNKLFYTFYDVGTGFKEKGSSDNNRLYLDKTDNSLKGKTVYNGNFYTVTQIRKN